jgi:hypothetical protein
MGGDIGGMFVVHRAERARGSSGGCGGGAHLLLMVLVVESGGFGGEGQAVEPVFMED